MSTKHQKIEVKLPGYSEAALEAIGQEIVEHIRERTEKGLDKNGDPLPKYSKQYIESEDFKNAGKSPSERNFIKTGNTLAALDVLEVKDGAVVIGWEKGSVENAIADGNIRGTYGTSTPGKGPRREILGIDPKRELPKILEEFPLDDERALDREIAIYLRSKKASGK